MKIIKLKIIDKPFPMKVPGRLYCYSIDQFLSSSSSRGEKIGNIDDAWIFVLGSVEHLNCDYISHKSTIILFDGIIKVIQFIDFTDVK